MEHRVVIVAIPEVQPLDVTGPAEVLAAASTAAARMGRSGYAVEVVAPGGGAIATGSSYGLLASGAARGGAGGGGGAGAGVILRATRVGGRPRGSPRRSTRSSWPAAPARATPART